MKIARVEHHPRRDRVRLHLEGDERRVDLALDLFMSAGLATGDELDSGRLAELERQDRRYRAREAALSLLAHRARSRTELRRRLWRKEFEDDVIDEVLGWLDERGYVDDRAFAESFVRDRLRLRPRGRRALMQELRRKGVADGIAAAAIEAVMAAEETDEVHLALEAARAWARKNGRALRKAADSTDGRLRARRRLYGHLSRRGFGGDALRRAIARVLDDDDD